MKARDEIEHTQHSREHLRAGICLLLAAALALSACGKGSAPAPLAFPSEPSGGIEIKYPLDETLFPPEIVAPTFVWSDKTEGVKTWTVLVRFDDKGEVLRFPTTEPRWRPSEADWAKIKQRSVARDAQVAIVGLGPDAQAASSATVRIRTSTDPVGDSIFYREVPLPFLTAVQDPSRIRWRFGSVDSETAPPIVLENLPVCGNCHSFSGDGKRPGPRRGLRQRQGCLRGPAGVEADGAERREDHHLERLQERRWRGHVRPALAGSRPTAAT